jgi:hypothetical protein
MIYQPADLRPKTLKTAVSGFFLLISVAYLERYLSVFAQTLKTSRRSFWPLDRTRRRTEYVLRFGKKKHIHVHAHFFTKPFGLFELCCWVLLEPAPNQPYAEPKPKTQTQF